MGLAKRVAEGVTAKLDFDYACNRGHSFGEYHVHGIVNEVLSANVDPHVLKVCSGFPHLRLRREGNGRKPEVDFAVMHRETETIRVISEVKWAGSGHCTAANVLKDLIRLQLIADVDQDAECFMLIAGHREDLDELFRHDLFTPGTRRMLSREASTQRAEERRKAFPLVENPHHQASIDACLTTFRERIPSIPDRIVYCLKSTALSAPPSGRFHSYAWRIHPSGQPIEG